MNSLFVITLGDVVGLVVIGICLLTAAILWAIDAIRKRHRKQQMEKKHASPPRPAMDQEPLYAAPLPPVLRDLSDEEINRVFGMCGVPQTQTLEWLVKECIKAAREA